ncbi:MAG: ABC transporter substrate-binding protein [Betaproteobacteria bacterium]|nr:ABC transporter substrate-binding protein [Betaproteobacteria bacterium]
MNRRGALFAMLAVGASRGAFAQAQPPRIGVLSRGKLEEPPLNALVRGLIERALIPGKTIVVEKPDVRGDYHEFAKMAGKMNHREALIVCDGFTATDAARKSAPDAPLVMVVEVDPVQRGLVQSLARPGGNATGVTLPGRELGAKRVGLLKEIVPGARRLGILWTSASGTEAEAVAEIEAAARRLGIETRTAEVRYAGALGDAFAAFAAFRADSLALVPSALFTGLARRIAEHAIELRLPAVFAQPADAHAGGLASYSPDFSAAMRRAAGFVERILRGARPADLPVEQSLKFELVVNMKTARAIGLTVPKSILLRADELIQ